MILKLIRLQKELKKKIKERQDKINELRAFLEAPMNVKIKNNLS